MLRVHRRRIGTMYGWMKVFELMRTARPRGLNRALPVITLTAATENLARMRNLGLGSESWNGTEPESAAR
jgi:hypothetical protein